MRKKGKKSRKIDLRKIKPTEVYSFKQVAKDLDRTVETVQRWKRDGMPIIEGTKPPLIDGAELLAYHKKKREDRKRPCAVDEIFCFICKTQRHPKIGSVIIRPVNQKRFSIDAECEECGCDMHKGGAMDTVEVFEAALESFMKNVRYIERYRNPPSNGT